MLSVAIGLIGLGTVAVVALAFWRAYGVPMCDRCKRPKHKCSCIEDGFVPPPNVIEIPARRKKPFDS